MSQGFDLYLAQCVRSFLASQTAPSFPDDLALDPDWASQRISFHGIALLLLQLDPALANWPKEVADYIREQARLQSFWETTHRGALAQIIAKSSASGIQPVIFKGTALAYSVYPDPALRRRGDTDLLIEKESLPAFRSVVAGLGFERVADTVALQETWRQPTNLGFDHIIDVHWHWKESAAISARLKKGLSGKWQKVQMGSQVMRTPDAIDSLILISINRASHESFGYRVGASHMDGNDRLIWAMDAHLITKSFTEEDWRSLIHRSVEASCLDLVSEMMAFAAQSIGTPAPDRILEAGPEARGFISQYLNDMSAVERFKADFSHSGALSEKAELLKFRLFPSRRDLMERFPDAKGWPAPALNARRLFAVMGRMVTGRS